MNSPLQSIVNQMSKIIVDQPVDWDPSIVYSAVEREADRLEARRHPLGFAQIELSPLVSLPAGTRARLHLWDNAEGSQDDLGDKHTHVWTLASWVMRGQLSDETYAPEVSVHGPYRGSRVKFGQTNTFPDAGRYQLTLVNERRPSAGSVYTMPADMVHESHVVEVPSATLLLATDVPELVAQGPLVFSPWGAAGSGTSRRVELNGREIRSVLAQYLAG